MSRQSFKASRARSILKIIENVEAKRGRDGQSES